MKGFVHNVWTLVESHHHHRVRIHRYILTHLLLRCVMCGMMGEDPD